MKENNDDYFDDENTDDGYDEKGYDTRKLKWLGGES